MTQITTDHLHNGYEITEDPREFCPFYVRAIRVRYATLEEAQACCDRLAARAAANAPRITFTEERGNRQAYRASTLRSREAARMAKGGRA